MRFFKLTRDKPTTGLMTIRQDDHIKLVNVSPNIGLLVEFSTTDGQTESLLLMDEIDLQNSAAYLRRSYFRMEIRIEKPENLKWTDEAHCKLEIRD